jgi:hypothetical protein
MKAKQTLLLSVLLGCLIINAQATVKVEWVQKYDFSSSDWAYSVLANQKDYYIAGNISESPGGRTAIIMKFNENGEKIWLKTYPLKDNRIWGKKLILANNNKNLQLICRISPMTSRPDETSVLNISFDGDMLDGKIFDSKATVPCFQQNSYIVASDDSIQRVDNKITIMSGALRDWGIVDNHNRSTTLESIFPLGVTSILYATSKHDSMVADIKYVGTYYGFKLIAIDCDLKPSWELDFKDVGDHDFISDLCHDKNYNCAFTGRKGSFSSFGIIDPIGSKLIYTTTFKGFGNSIFSKTENEYVIAGESNESFYVACVNAKGSVLWDINPITTKSSAESVCITEGGAILACGYVNSGNIIKGQIDTDIMIVKLTISEGEK